MKKILPIVLGVLIAFPLYGDPIHLGLEDDYRETPGRRAEVIFFLSLPFALLTQGLIIAGLYAVNNPNDPLQFNVATYSFWIGGSLLISGGIAYADYRDTCLREKEEQTQDHKEARYYVQLNHRF